MARGMLGSVVVVGARMLGRLVDSVLGGPIGGDGQTATMLVDGRGCRYRVMGEPSPHGLWIEGEAATGRHGVSALVRSRLSICYKERERRCVISLWFSCMHSA